MKFYKGIIPWNKGTKGLIKPNSGSFKKGQFSNENHPLWKGTEAKYSAIHNWLHRHYGKASHCENNINHINRTYHWANLSGEYKRDILDWAQLCVSCHQHLDGNRYKQWRTRRML